MNAKSFLLIPLVAALVACGDSDSNLSTSPGASTVSVLITDNLTRDYKDVWVEVYSIKAIDANGQAVVLFEDTSGQTHNLSQLVNIGALVNTRTVTPGTYTSFEIVLSNEITLIDQTGNPVSATFGQGGGSSHTITVDGNLVVNPNQPATLVLDFDLASFTYDPATNTVAPVVVQKDPDALAQVVATVRGEIQVINGPGQFVVSSMNGGASITVNLHDNATVTDPANNSVVSDTAILQSGMKVNVSGGYDSDTLTITATSVVIERASAPIVLRHEVEGYVISVDGSVVRLDIEEATFRPGSNALSIDLGNALFTKGGLTMLAAGQEIEIYGDWDGTSFSAAVAEIEGAARNVGSRSYDDHYAEIEGIVTAVTDQTVTLTVREYEHVSGINVGQSITINHGSAWYKYGDAACLVPNMEIEVKGAFTASAMDAYIIEYDDHSCYGAYGGGEYAEIEGTVTAVTSDTVTLTVHEHEHARGITIGQSVTVDRNDVWYKDGDASCLVPGVRVEIEGAFDGTTMDAFAIEFEDGSCHGSFRGGDLPELEGVISAVTADTVTLAVQEYEYVSGISIGQHVTVNRNGARYEDGSVSCLAPGVRIEVEGTFDGTMMQARVIEFEDGDCGYYD